MILLCMDSRTKAGKDSMTPREKRACSHFLKDGAPEVLAMNTPIQELGYADRILQAGMQSKRARIEKSKY